MSLLSVITAFAAQLDPLGALDWIEDWVDVDWDFWDGEYK